MSTFDTDGLEVRSEMPSAASMLSTRINSSNCWSLVSLFGQTFTPRRIRNTRLTFRSLESYRFSPWFHRKLHRMLVGCHCPRRDSSISVRHPAVDERRRKAGRSMREQWRLDVPSGFRRWWNDSSVNGASARRIETDRLHSVHLSLNSLKNNNK